MKIYLAHSTKFDFQNELYGPIKKSDSYNTHLFVLPHDDPIWVNSKETIKNSDLIIADITHPSTSLGIELGWADAFGVPIVCIYKEGEGLSRSIKAVSSYARKYNIENLSEILKEIIRDI